jgi:hypothetical protein
MTHARLKVSAIALAAFILGLVFAPSTVQTAVNYLYSVVE